MAGFAFVVNTFATHQGSLTDIETVGRLALFVMITLASFILSVYLARKLDEDEKSVTAGDSKKSILARALKYLAPVASFLLASICTGLAITLK